MKTISQIEYVIGDATNPIGDGLKIVCHCVNTLGLWGAGFVLALSKKSKTPEISYRKWHKDGFYISDRAGKVPFQLGKVQFAPFDKSVLVCNIIGQEGVGFHAGVPPIRYKSIEDSFNMMRTIMGDDKFSVHMPRIGCGLAGGKWNEIERTIKDTLCSYGIKVVVYDFDEVASKNYPRGS